MTTTPLPLSSLTPGPYQTMLHLSELARGALPAGLVALVSLRVSQLNGCAYCIDLHARQSRMAGESDDRLNLLCVWRRTELFDDRERAALALAEAVTLLLGSDLDEAYPRAAERFTATELAHLLWTAATVNTWNRMAISSGLTVERRLTGAASAVT